MKFSKDAIHKAAYNGEMEKVKEILALKPNPDDRDSFGGTALHAAMFQSNLEIVKILVENGYDVNAIGPQNGYSPMHDAVWADNIGAVKYLVSKGGKTDIKAKDGLTPFMKAKKEGKTEIIKYFESIGIRD